MSRNNVVVLLHKRFELAHKDIIRNRYYGGILLIHTSELHYGAVIAYLGKGTPLQDERVLLDIGLTIEQLSGQLLNAKGCTLAWGNTQIGIYTLHVFERHALQSIKYREQENDGRNGYGHSHYAHGRDHIDHGV